MRLERCTNIACLRPYQVNEFDFGHHDLAARDAQYTCPHCGHAQRRVVNRIVLVHALTREQEEEFNRIHPVRQRTKLAHCG